MPGWRFFSSGTSHLQEGQAAVGKDDQPQRAGAIHRAARESRQAKAQQRLQAWAVEQHRDRQNQRNPELRRNICSWPL